VDVLTENGATLKFFSLSTRCGVETTRLQLTVAEGCDVKEVYIRLQFSPILMNRSNMNTRTLVYSNTLV
jgi:hypothetical protein